MAPYQCLHFHYIIIFDYINTHVQKKKKITCSYFLNLVSVLSPNWLKAALPRSSTQRDRSQFEVGEAQAAKVGG